jgi:hypothetical protein
MTEVRPVVLREELMKTYREIGRQTDEVNKIAKDMGIEPHQLRDTSGNWLIVPLLVARVQILHSLTLLNQKGN